MRDIDKQLADMERRAGTRRPRRRPPHAYAFTSVILLVSLCLGTRWIPVDMSIIMDWLIFVLAGGTLIRFILGG